MCMHNHDNTVACKALCYNRILRAHNKRKLHVMNVCCNPIQNIPVKSGPGNTLGEKERETTPLHVA